MSWVMFRKALKDLRWTVFWYAFGLVLYGILILSFYPSVRENAEEMQQLMGAFPKSVMEAFGANNMSTLAGWVGGKYLNVMWPLIMSVFIIMAGAATVAREVERGTIELLLSVPESRTRLLAAKLVALFTGILVLVAATIGSIALGAVLVDETLAFENLLALGAVLLCFSVAVAGYAVMLSSFSKERSKPAGMAAGLTLASYLAWVVSDLSKDWEWLRNVSIFTAYEPQPALQSGHIELAHLGALIAVGLISSVVALAIFRRRDAIS
ncbi:MAG TPA: ABC transporter permease subunit [Rubrobacter sp.]|nr:ABC transporter permease subunit [Rubrobacter sp.]